LETSDPFSSPSSRQRSGGDTPSAVKSSNTPPFVARRATGLTALGFVFPKVEEAQLANAPSVSRAPLLGAGAIGRNTLCVKASASAGGGSADGLRVFSKPLERERLAETLPTGVLVRLIE
jgi:hypothetical protein